MRSKDTDTNEKLLKSVRDLFEKHDIAEVNVTYEGSGDSGQFEPGTVVFLDGTERSMEGNPAGMEDNTGTDEVTYRLVLKKQPYTQEYYDQKKQKYVKKKAFRDVPFSDYMMEIAEHFVSIVHGGWENNEGARGTVTIHRAKVGIEVLADVQRRRLIVDVDHVDYYQGEEEYSERYTSDTDKNIIVDATAKDDPPATNKSAWQNILSTALSEAVEYTYRKTHNLKDRTALETLVKQVASIIESLDTQEP